MTREQPNETDALRAEWFADWDAEANPDYPWQPVLMEADSAVVLTSCETYFRTERECLDFIRTYLVGAGLDRDIPPEVTS